MREFNLEEAKSGVPVCTRDGHAARIICTNRQYCMPIVALIYSLPDEGATIEFIQNYYDNGRVYIGDRLSDDDLFMQY